MRNQAAIAGATISLIVSMSAIQASEVWVQQARGRVSGVAAAEENAPVKATPEGTATAGATNTAADATNPATCNQANASSPACYSATQQSRGK